MDSPASRKKSGDMFVLVLAPWPTGIGGIEQVTRDMLRVLSDRYGKGRVGLVQVWCGGPVDDLPATVLRWGPRRGGERDRIHPFNKVGFVLSALRAAAGKRGRLVVVSAHPYLAPVGMACASIARAPHIVWAYGSEAWTRPPRLVAAALRRATQILAISSFTESKVKASVGIPSNRIRVLHLPVRDSVATAARDRRVKNEPGLSEEPMLLTVGRLDITEQQKGMDTVIRSLPQIAEAHPGVRFVVVGEGEDRDRLEKLSEQVAVRNRVEFTGAVEDDRLMDLYAQADVFVMPSAQEGFGLVFIEAMAFGTPVIGGDHGGTPDVVRSGETGFLVPFGDEEAIANRVIRLLSDDALRSRMGAEGVRDVQERFSFDTFARNVTEAVGEAERF